MKKILAIAVVMALISSAAISQTVNDANAETRSVGSFHGIEVGTGIQLTLTQGSESVAVSAAKTEFRDKIVTKVVNGVLSIYYESRTEAPNTRKEKKELRAYVSYKELDILNANTGGNVKLVGVLKSPSLSMKTNTGGNVDAEIDVNTLTIDQNTGSKIALTGKAGSLTIEGNTGSKFEGEGLTTDNCEVSVSTGAKVSIHAEKELQANASTGGNVKYKGNPTLKEIKKSTGGSVSKI